MIVELNEILSSYLPRLHGAHSKYIRKINDMTPAQAENPFLICSDWTILPDMFLLYEKEFESLGPQNDMLSGRQLREKLLASGLEANQLKSIWELADMNKDGFLDKYEFAIAKFLIDQVKSDPKSRLPNMLPPSLKPPLKF